MGNWVKYLYTDQYNSSILRIIFPGGATYFNETAGYGEAAKILYRLAVKANKEGIYYPIWGTCLGMEVFAFAILGEDIRVDCDLHKVAIPLEFSNGKSKYNKYCQN